MKFQSEGYFTGISTFSRLWKGSIHPYPLSFNFPNEPYSYYLSLLFSERAELPEPVSLTFLVVFRFGLFSPFLLLFFGKEIKPSTHFFLFYTHPVYKILTCCLTVLKGNMLHCANVLKSEKVYQC